MPQNDRFQYSLKDITDYHDIGIDLMTIFILPSIIDAQFRDTGIHKNDKS